MELKKWGPLRGEITVPGDKSISHRAVMFGSLAKGTTEIHGFLQGADCLSTISCFEKMGVSGTWKRPSRPKKTGNYIGLRKQRHHHPPDLRHPQRTGF